MPARFAWRRLAVLAVVVLLAACDPAANLPPPTTLPSGAQIRVLAVSRIAFAKDVPALMLRYQTSLSLGDEVAIAREVDEVWLTFRRDAERNGMTSAIISVEEVPTGTIIQESRATRFVYRQAADGTWSQLANNR